MQISEAKLDLPIRTSIIIVLILFPRFHWGHDSKCFMRSFVVVVICPLVCHLTHFSDAPEDVGIEDGSSVGSVEAFNVAVLCRTSGLGI